MLNPVLKIHTESVYPSKHKNVFDQIKTKAFSSKRTSNKEIGINNLNTESMRNRMMTISVSAPKQGTVLFCNNDIAELSNSLNTSSLKSISGKYISCKSIDIEESSKRLIPESPLISETLNIKNSNPLKAQLFKINKASSTTQIPNQEMHKMEIVNMKAGKTVRDANDPISTTYLNKIEEEDPVHRVPQVFIIIQSFLDKLHAQASKNAWISFGKLQL